MASSAAEAIAAKHNADVKTAGIGHNSGATKAAQDQIKAFVERIERMEEEKKVVAEDIRGIYAEAKCNGYDTKALREIIRIRKKDRDEQAEFEAVVDTYKHALGMLL
jgi:uncharacterized protein (UPF0335 family)